MERNASGTALNIIRRRRSPGPSRLTRPIPPPLEGCDIIAKNPSLITDPSGYCVWVSGALLTMLGVRPEDLLGDGWKPLLHPDWTPDKDADWADPSCCGRSFTRIRFSRIGARHYYHTQTVTMMSADGARVEGHACIVRDITIHALRSARREQSA